eukprot:6135743-Pleurochrysis_carterae.AAC.1
MEVESGQKKCPAAFLRGKCTFTPALQEAAASGWELYLAYTPGFGDNFSPAPLKFAFGFGGTVDCLPPFLSISAGTNNAPTPDKAVLGIVIGILIGEGSYASTSKKGTRKTRTENRRYAIVRIHGIDCFEPFERLSCKADAADLPLARQRVLLGECVDLCAAAALARKPATVHSTLNTENTKQTNLRAANEACSAYAAANAAAASDAIDTSTPVPDGGRRVSHRRINDASKPSSSAVGFAESTAANTPSDAS